MKPLKSPFWRETGLGNTLLLLKDSRLQWISTSKSRSCLHEETTHYWSLLHLLAWSKCSFDSTTAPAGLDMVPSVIANISACLLNWHSGWWTYPCQLTCNTDIWNMQFSHWSNIILIKKKLNTNTKLFKSFLRPDECRKQLESVRGSFKSFCMVYWK